MEVVLDDRLLIDELLVGIALIGAERGFTRRHIGTTEPAALRWLAPADICRDRSESCPWTSSDEQSPQCSSFRTISASARPDPSFRSW